MACDGSCSDLTLRDLRASVVKKSYDSSPFLNEGRLLAESRTASDVESPQAVITTDARRTRRILVIYLRGLRASVVITLRFPMFVVSHARL